VKESERVALAQKLPFRSWRQPYDVSLGAQFVGGLASKAEVVKAVAGNHLLAVSPHPVVGAEEPLTGDVRLGPIDAKVMRVLFGCGDVRAVADAHAATAHSQ